MKFEIWNLEFVYGFFAAIVLAAGFLIACPSSKAASLAFVSDTISTSAPATPADHTVSFKLAAAVPAGGKIIITPEDGKFIIPNNLDYSDIDVSINNVEQTLSATSSVADFQAQVTSGASGNIIFVPNSQVDALSTVSVKIGRNANFGAIGSRQIVNPSAVGSYSIYIQTQDSGGNSLDKANAMIAVVESVRMGAATPAPEAYCGDNVCNGSETCSTCSQDCGSCSGANCGDNVCNGSETCSTCPQDCGSCPNPYCGDNVCNGSETCGSCPGDCGACPVSCGDGVCNGSETCSTCSQDCGSCSGAHCGDNVCNGSETCSTCSQDCGACPVSCGDNVCNGSETCSTCSQDCGSCPGSYCGDNVCNGSETCSTCSQDCGACPPPGGGGGALPYTDVPAQTVFYQHIDGSFYKLELPAWYWNSPAVFTVTPSYAEVIKYLETPPSGLSLVGDHGYNVSGVDFMKNPLATVNKDSTVTLHYTQAQADLFYENTISLYVWTGSAFGWQSVSGSKLNLADKTLKGITRNMGIYALFGKAKPVRPNVPVKPVAPVVPPNVPVVPPNIPVPPVVPVVPPPATTTPTSTPPVIQKDIWPPDAFTPVITRSPGLFGGKYFVVFSTRDRGSGIDYYEAAEQPLCNCGDQQADLKSLRWEKSESPYVLKHQYGFVRVYVRAVDKAGNVTVGITQAQLCPPPPCWYWPLLELLIVLLLLVLWWAWRRRRKKKNHHGGELLGV